MKKTKKTIVRFILIFLVATSALMLFALQGAGPADAQTAGRAFPSFSYVSGSLEEADVRISLEDLSPYLTDAVVAVEDRRFYEHRGLDYVRILSAFFTNLRAGRIVEGGSTISQQYVKNAYLGPERTLTRKIREAYLTIKLERQYSKEEILLLYLDTIYFGSGVFGIIDASMLYFGIEPSELDLAQSALLAGVIRSPENYSPLNNPELSMTRRNLVLALMYHQKYIDKEEYVRAVSVPLDLQ
jgi:membrane peptidoglycan carboxypeptidase